MFLSIQVFSLGLGGAELQRSVAVPAIDDGNGVCRDELIVEVEEGGRGRRLEHCYD